MSEKIGVGREGKGEFFPGLGKGDRVFPVGDGAAPLLLLGRMGRAGCDLFAFHIQAWGVVTVGSKYISVESLPGPLALQR